MKKFTKIGSALTAVLMIAATMTTMTTSVFAASAPGDDAEGYSYNTGKKSYETRMAEDHAWYDNKDDSITSGYSFNTGSQAALSRNNIFEGIPADENMKKEDIEAWFEENNLGEGSAWSDGQYDESSKNSYGYSLGQAAYQQRQSSSSSNN